MRESNPLLITVIIQLRATDIFVFRNDNKCMINDNKNDNKLNSLITLILSSIIKVTI